MDPIQICVNSDIISVNGRLWTSAPLLHELCEALGSTSLSEGDHVVIEGKKTAKFRYFQELGIAILELIPSKRIKRISLYFDTPPKRSIFQMPSRSFLGERPTITTYTGSLEVNGKLLKPPIRYKQFPEKGDLLFIHNIAIGKATSAAYYTYSGFVETIKMEFSAFE